MDFTELQPFVLLMVLVGMILGVGILVLDKFSEATKTSTSVGNENITITAGAGSTDNAQVTGVSYFANATSDYSSFIAGNGINWTSAGAISVNASVKAGAYNISYTYLKNETTTEVLGSVMGELGNLSSSWLGLIVTIAILSVILLLVIRSFSGTRQR